MCRWVWSNHRQQERGFRLEAVSVYSCLSEGHADFSYFISHSRMCLLFLERRRGNESGGGRERERNLDLLPPVLAPTWDGTGDIGTSALTWNGTLNLLV